MSVSSVSSSSRSEQSNKTEKSSQTQAPKADAGQEKKDTAKAPVAARTTDRFDPAASSGTGPSRPTPPPAKIDPRIATEANIQVTVKPHSEGPAGTMAVDTVRYQNDQQSGGNHNIYVRITDANGQEIPPEDMNRCFDVQYVPGPGMPVTSASPKMNDPYGVQKDTWTTSANTGGPTAGYFDIPMWGGNQTQVWVKPKDVPGNPYAGYGSQEVGPLSMPANHHVNYMVTFKATPGASSGTEPGPIDPKPPPPPPPAGSTEQMVEGLYQSLLGRASDPAGKANWVNYANHLAGQGKSQQEVQDTLTALFKQSDEYKALHGTKPDPVTPPPPVGTSGYAPGDTLQVNAPGGLNLRAGPSVNEARIGGLADGTRLQVSAPPDGGPTSRNGWVHVSGPAGNGWVSEQFVQKAGGGTNPGGGDGTTQPGDGRLLGLDGKPQSYVAGNYTDLGRANDGHMPDPLTDPAGFRAAVEQDLNRLQGMSVDNVRIWGADFPENPLGNNLDALSARVRIISEEAARRGMTVTVDLFDGATMNKNVNDYRGRDAEINARIQTIVGQNAKANNIYWSVGNEIGDPANPSGFADWYTEKADLIRQTVRANGGDTNRQLISMQMTPGALGHPTHGWGGAEAAMRRVVAASDIISPHFYPTGMPGQLPWENKRPDGSSQGTYPQMDYDSLKVWARLAKESGKPVTVGEFSVPRDTQATQGLSEQEYANMTEAWMRELRNEGIQQVSFWQFAKDEGGHVDPASVDFVVGDNAGDTRTLIDRLHKNEWFN